MVYSLPLHKQSTVMSHEHHFCAGRKAQANIHLPLWPCCPNSSAFSCLFSSSATSRASEMVWWESASESKSYWSCKYRSHLAHFASGSTTSASEKSVSTSLAGPSAGFGPEIGFYVLGRTQCRIRSTLTRVICFCHDALIGPWLIACVRRFRR